MMPASIRTAAALAGALALSLAAGCSSTLHVDPAYRSAVYDAPASVPVDVASAERSRDAAEPPPAVVQDGEPLEDLPLDIARQLALQRSHTVAAASATVSAAAARIAEARAAFLPTLSFNLQRTVNRETTSVSIPGIGNFETSPGDVTTGQAQLALSLFAFGRDWEAMKAARAEVDTRVLDERRVRQQLLYEVTQAWYRVHEAVSQVEVARDGLAATERQLVDAQNVFEAERATRDAVLTAQVEVLRRRQELLIAENAVIHARRILNVLLVRTPDAEISLAPAAEYRRAVLDEELLCAWGREHNPAILAFRTQRASLDHLRESVERSFAPELVGTLGADHTSFDQATGFSTNYSAAVGVTWTPVNGGRRIGRLAEIHANLVVLREQELGALQQLELDIKRAVLDLSENDSALELARQSIEAAVENQRIIGDRFRVGRTTSRELLEAQRTLSNARFVFNSARFMQRTLLARIESLVGVEMREWLPEGP